MEASKSKKKSEKFSRIAPEKDFLDEVLPELSVSTSTIQEGNVCVHAEPVGSVDTTGEEKEDEAETRESAAAKKKRKKKEKEKEKKAAAAAVATAAIVTTVEAKEEQQEEAKSEISSKKKVPKHVREKQEELARRKESEEVQKKEKEEELRKEEEERLRQEEIERQVEEVRRRKKEREKEKILNKKQEGKLLTGKQKEESRRLEAMRNQFLANCNALPVPGKGRPNYERKKANSVPVQANDEPTINTVKNIEVKENEAGAEKDNKVESSITDSVKKVGVKHRTEETAVGEEWSSEEDNLRSPICCIMGHVDTGKTKLLDFLRGTNVQGGEAGGITQQIGATFFPVENIRKKTKELKSDAQFQVPGLLVIDTPGHESFKNLRSRGAAFCDVAILVVDIMHGLEPQTIESLNLLRSQETKFIVALNKVDRLYGWKTCTNAPIGKAMRHQSMNVKDEFETRLINIITQFKEQGLNTELYYRNKEMEETFSIVPTSAISGEGIPDLLLLLVQWTQKTMVEKLMFSNKVQCTVMEVKVVEGLGTTIDVILFNGVLHEGDQIVVCGMQEPIVTTIRALMTPRPMMEIRVKGSYLRHKQIKASQSIRISAQGLEDAIAGTGLYAVGPEDDVEGIKKEVMKEGVESMKSILSKIDRSKEGVCVQASTLGSLEALLEYLNYPEVNIPVRGISIGPVHKKDIMKASAMLERKKEYATILAFDVKVMPEACDLANEVGVNIFSADIIYHLFDQFEACIKNIEEKKQPVEAAVFPCILRIKPGCVINKKDPIILGVNVCEGIAKVGTPICVPSKGFINIGRIASIESDHKQLDVAKKGQEVSITICSSSPDEQEKMFGRHFEIDDDLVSRITRNSIDTLKDNFRKDLSNEEWRLIVRLKGIFRVQC